MGKALSAALAPAHCHCHKTAERSDGGSSRHPPKHRLERVNVVDDQELCPGSGDEAIEIAVSGDEKQECGVNKVKRDFP